MAASKKVLQLFAKLYYSLLAMWEATRLVASVLALSTEGTLIPVGQEGRNGEVDSIVHYAQVCCHVL